VVRAPHVYLRIRTDAVRDWVTKWFNSQKVKFGNEGSARSVSISAPSIRDASSGSLELFRAAILGRATAALLESRGYCIDWNKVEPSPYQDGREAVARSHAVLVRRAEDPQFTRLPIGEVDVPHGGLRARYGGGVRVRDLLDAIGARLWSRKSYGDLTAHRFDAAPDAQDEATLTFVFLRTERGRRLQLTDNKVEAESAAFESVLYSSEIALRNAKCVDNSRRVKEEQTAEDRARDLALELDCLASTAARACSELEPALVGRYLRSLADRARAADGYVIETDPLWPAVAVGIEAGLRLMGIDLGKVLAAAELEVSSSVGR